MSISTVKQYGSDVLSAARNPEPVKVTLDRLDFRGQVEHRISLRAYWTNDAGDVLPGKGVQVPADPAVLDALIDALTEARQDAEQGHAQVAFSVAVVGKEKVAIARRRVAAAKGRKEATPVKKTVAVKKAAARRR